MSSEPPRRHSLALTSSYDASREASAWARKLIESARLSDEQAYALDLCMVELVTNIVNHGYRGKAGDIQLLMDIGEGEAILTVIDHAPAFDPLSYPAPAVPASIDDAKVGGYGIHMVRSMADGVRYERRDDHNIFTAWFGG